MNQTQFRIPKLKDRTLVDAMISIRDGLKDLRSLSVRVTPCFGAQEVNVPDKEPERESALGYIFHENSEIMPCLTLVDSSGQQSLVVLQIDRQTKDVTDLVDIDKNSGFLGWANRVPQSIRSQFVVKLMSLARKQLRACDAEASFSGSADTEWTRYRDAQQAILNSLQETQKSVLTEIARKSLEGEAHLKAKYDGLESQLRARSDEFEGKLQEEHQSRLKVIEERELALKKREESFNTKEARYVARQEQQNQITQIKGWLEGWSLTAGTRSKRWWVMGAYSVGVVATGFLAIWYSFQNVEILKGQVFKEVAWWQWMLLSLRSILPVAAFTTFVIYFIRWSASWAGQHAEEEFRNRARVLDIGRTAWLLEAVRDAQDNGKELPPDLLKELSRNLFAYAQYSDGGDIHPHAVTDLIMQGLSSVRLKSPDGAEIEATRAKAK